jgi:hypothetical protein
MVSLVTKIINVFIVNVYILIFSVLKETLISINKIIIQRLFFLMSAPQTITVTLLDGRLLLNIVCRDVGEFGA